MSDRPDDDLEPKDEDLDLIGRDWTKPRLNRKTGVVDQVSLTPKERLFIIGYLKYLNSEKAAKYAGYGGTDLSALGSGFQARPDIREIINRELARRHLSPTEVKAYIEATAVADITDCFIEYPVYETQNGRTVFDADGKPVQKIDPTTLQPMVVRDVNWDKVRELGPRVKRIEFTKDGPRVELYDAQRAQELLGRHHRLFVDTLDIHEDGEVVVKIVKGVSLEDV